MVYSISRKLSKNTFAACLLAAGSLVAGVAQAATVSPTSLTFAAQKVGTTSTSQTLTITHQNVGLTVTTTGITATVSGAGFAIASNTCTGATLSSLSPTCAITVTFTPGNTGDTFTGSVAISSTPATTPSSVSLSGSSPAPVATVNPTSLAFSDQVVNTTSSAKTYTLSNGGGVNDLTGVSIALGVNTSDFAQTNNCGATVVAGSPCTVSVTFTPTATGARTGSVVASSSNGGNATTQLSGNGVVLAPVLNLSPTSLSFSNQTTGSTSATQAVTLRNTGNAPLTVNSIAVAGTNAGDFAQTNNCTNPIAAAASCTINVSFTPTATGTRSGSITVTSNGGNSSVTLSGTGIAPNTPVVSLSPTSLTFSNQMQNTTSAAKTVTLSNTGNAPLTVGTMSFTGANAGDFAQTNNCTTVNAGSSCTINVTFTPTSLGNRSAMLNINSNASSSPNSVALSGSTVSSSKAVTLADGRVVTLLSSQGTIDSLTVAATPTSGLPAGVTYPVGFFNYQVSGVTGGSTVTFSYVLPVGAVANTYVKCVAGTCSPLTGSNSSADGRTVTFTIQDNGPNDSNATSGVITDPGAPGFIANTNSTATATTADSSSGAMGVEMLLLMGLPALLLSRRRKQLGSDPN